MTGNGEARVRLTKAEARAWVRAHWVKFLLHADVPGPPWPPEDVEAIWADECQRIARRITPAGRRALENSHED